MLVGYATSRVARPWRVQAWRANDPRQAGGRVICRHRHLRFLLLALMKAFQDRCAPWYQRGLIRKPLRKISVILLHDVERRFLGELAMVFRK
jgi:hypothetical protein